MSTLRVNSLLNAAGTDTPAIDGLAKAWVNFNGTGTVAIRAAFNVSSITDNGTGDYWVNFTNPMIDSNYSVSAISLPQVSYTERMKLFNPGLEVGRVRIMNNQTGDGNVGQDSTIITATIFR